MPPASQPQDGVHGWRALFQTLERPHLAPKALPAWLLGFACPLQASPCNVPSQVGTAAVQSPSVLLSGQQCCPLLQAPPPLSAIGSAAPPHAPSWVPRPLG